MTARETERQRMGKTQRERGRDTHTARASSERECLVKVTLRS